jgi:protein-disulfide isomerase
MSAHSQRGRTVKSRQNATILRFFYIVLSLVVIAGIAVITIAALGKPQQLSTVAGVAGSVAAVPNNLPAKGRADAPVTVIEYSDFQCPACGLFATEMQAQFERDYVDTGKVRLLYHDFPLPQHRNAIPAAEAARCAADQNVFWNMYQMLFFNQQEWAEQPQPLNQFLSYADKNRLNRATFQRCMNDHTHRAEVLLAQRTGNQAGINQTPTFVIDGRQYTALDLRAAVDAALIAKRK